HRHLALPMVGRTLTRLETAMRSMQLRSRMRRGEAVRVRLDAPLDQRGEVVQPLGALIAWLRVRHGRPPPSGDGFDCVLGGAVVDHDRERVAWPATDEGLAERRLVGDLGDVTLEDPCFDRRDDLYLEGVGAAFVLQRHDGADVDTVERSSLDDVGTTELVLELVDALLDA